MTHENYDIQTSVSIKFLEPTNMYLFYVLAVAAFARQQQRWAAVTEDTWPTEIFTIWPFTRKVCRLPFYCTGPHSMVCGRHTLQACGALRQGLREETTDPSKEGKKGGGGGGWELKYPVPVSLLTKWWMFALWKVSSCSPPPSRRCHLQLHGRQLGSPNLHPAVWRYI